MTPSLFYVMTEPEKKKYTISEEERQRRSDRAKAMHKEIADPATGRRRLGGPQPSSGRPKKKRPTEIWNEKIEKHAEEVWTALYRAMRSNKEMVSLQAVKQIVEITNKETDVMFKEERSIDSTSTEELIDLVSNRLARLAEAGKLPFDIELGDESISEVPAGELEVGSAQDESQGLSGIGETDATTGTSAFARRSPKR